MRVRKTAEVSLAVGMLLLGLVSQVGAQSYLFPVPGGTQLGPWTTSGLGPVPGLAPQRPPSTVVDIPGLANSSATRATGSSNEPTIQEPSTMSEERSEQEPPR